MRRTSKISLKTCFLSRVSWNMWSQASGSRIWWIYLLLTAITAISEVTPITDWIIDRFPTNPDAFTTSLASKLLSRFSLSLLFLHYPFPKETLRIIHDHRRSVQLAFGLLPALASLSFIENTHSDAAKEVEDDRFIKVKHKTQRANKRAKRFGIGSAVDSKVFQIFDVPVPSTRQDADVLARTILEDQKHALQVLKLISENS